MKFKNCLFFTFILFVVLLLVNNVHSGDAPPTTSPTPPPPVIKGGLFKEEYDSVLNLATKVGILNEFQFISKDVYDFCGKKQTFFTCLSNTIISIDIDHDYSIKLEHDKDFKFKNLNSVILSLFEVDDKILQIPTVNIKLVQCNTTEVNSMVFKPSNKTKAIYIDLITTFDGEMEVDPTGFNSITDFTITSSLPIEQGFKISYKLDPNQDINSVNWDIISTDVPHFGESCGITNLKLRILENITTGKNSGMSNFVSFSEIKTVQLLKYSDDIAPIDFPLKLFSSKEITYFGTTFRLKHTDKLIDLSSAQSLLKLEIVNAEGFSFFSNIIDPKNPKNPIFPFSKFPSNFTELIYRDNNESLPFPNLEDIFSGTKVQKIDLSNNKMTGINATTDIKIPNLSKLNLSNNNLKGVVNNWVCKVNENGLILKNNHLHGSLPECIPCFSTQKSIESNILVGNQFRSDSSICDLNLIFSSISISSTTDPKSNETTYKIEGNGLNDFTSDPKLTWKPISINTIYQSEPVDEVYTRFSITIKNVTVKISTVGNSTPQIDDISAKLTNENTLKVEVKGGFLSYSQSAIKAYYQTNAINPEPKPFECFVLPYPTLFDFSVDCPYPYFSDKSISMGIPQLQIVIDGKQVNKNFTIDCAQDCSLINGSKCNDILGVCSCPDDCNFNSVKSASHGYCDYTELLNPVCICEQGWEGGTCLVGNCEQHKNCSGDSHGKCDTVKSSCNCHTGWSSDTCDIPMGGNGNGNGNGGNDDSTGGSTYVIFILLLFIIAIGLSVLIYKKYLANGTSSSDSGSSIKFKTLNSTRNVDDEEDNIPMRKTFEDDE